MKKIIPTFFLPILFMGLVESIKAQSPVVPYGDHTTDGITKFAMAMDENGKALKGADLQASKDFGNMIIDNINAEARRLKKTWILTREHLQAIFSKYTTLQEVRLLAGTYYNSSKNGSGNISYGSLSNQDFEGYAGVFEYDGVRLVIFKWNCLNVLRIVPSQTDLPAPAPKKPDTTTLPPVVKRDTSYHHTTIYDTTWKKTTEYTETPLEKIPQGGYYYRDTRGAYFYFDVALSFGMQRYYGYIPCARPIQVMYGPPIVIRRPIIIREPIVIQRPPRNEPPVYGHPIEKPPRDEMPHPNPHPNPGGPVGAPGGGVGGPGGAPGSPANPGNGNPGGSPGGGSGGPGGGPGGAPGGPANGSIRQRFGQGQIRTDSYRNSSGGTTTTTWRTATSENRFQPNSNPNQNAFRQNGQRFGNSQRMQRMQSYPNTRFQQPNQNQPRFYQNGGGQRFGNSGGRGWRRG